MLRKVLLGIVICLVPIGFLYGQSTHIEEQTVIPSSPQAASLFKYVETPVSYFTGLPNINIPLHEISEGGISVAISLSYHAGGIKVTEEGSWVGLGWNLNAGGAITRVVKGMADECVANNTYYVYPDPHGNEYNELAKNINLERCYYFDKDGENLDMETFLFGNKNNFDSEPDLYMYNFGGYSGKFFRSQGKYYDISHNNIEFNIENSLEISALAPDGLKYYFYVTEMSKTAPASSACNSLPIPHTYFLSRIESPYNTNDGVDFSYINFKNLLDSNPEWRQDFSSELTADNEHYVPQMPQLSEQYVRTADPSGGNGQHRNYTFGYTDLQYLERIDFKNGYVKFNVSPREDLFGFKMDYIGIYRKGETTPIKEYHFNYGYFEGDNRAGGDYMTLRSTNSSGNYWVDYPEEYRKKRLKLLSVTEKSGSLEGRKHSFAYDETISLPYKTSFSQDYWGYNNGENAGIKTMIPDFRRYLYQMELPMELRHWTGANREPNEDYMKAGLLKKITYPTRGWTEFDFEINEFTNLGNQQGREWKEFIVKAEDVNLDENGKYVAGQAMDTFEIKFEPTVVEVAVNLFCETKSNEKNCKDGEITWSCENNVYENDSTYSIYAYIEKWNSAHKTWVRMDQHTWDLSKNEIRDCENGGGGTYTYEPVLQPGLYRAVANLPDKRRETPYVLDNPGYPGDKMASIFIKYSRQTEFINTSNTGGGLRVSKITNFDPEENSSIDRVFSYEGGIMTRFPIFYWFTIKIRWHDQTMGLFKYYDTHYLYSSPNVPYSFSANGALVGYEKVTETTSGNGKIEYEYKVREDLLDYRFAENLAPVRIDLRQYLPGVPSTAFLDNGNLLSTKYYREGAPTPLKEIKNKYKILKPGMAWNFKLLDNYPALDVIVGYCGVISTSFYPVKYGKMVLSESETKTVDDNGNTTLQTMKYKYDNNDHLQLTRKIASQSDGRKLVTQILYPQDYTNTSGFVGEMKANNRIANPIEIVSYSTNETGGDIKVLGAKLTTYHGGNKVGLPDKVWLLEPSNPIPLSEFRFSNQESANALPHAGNPDDPVRTDFAINEKDSSYPEREKLSYSFDGSGNLQEMRQKAYTYYASNNLEDEQQRNNGATAYVWGYNGVLPIAQVHNARAKNIFHTSFEEDGNKTGGDSKTGLKSLRTGANGYVKTLHNLSIGTYVLSYWQKINGNWVFKSRIENVAPFSHTIKLPANIQIDELRFHPADAQMNTFTYDPLVGKTSEMDPNGVLVNYEYDALGRLEFIKDEQGNILNKYEYHYKDQP